MDYTQEGKTQNTYHVSKQPNPQDFKPSSRTLDKTGSYRA
ncbi:unnamed protein product [marine sediment metagenome]|uniref:Uncharacterized protein n=1 Tax=marine sediment metagenome TaxID=412755 RepID=X1BJY1_9ZZZZ